VSADEAKGKKPQEEIEGPVAPKTKVTSQMLLNKFQHDRKDDNTERRLHDAMRGIGGVLSLCTVGKKGRLYRQ
jgi:hypothetical protein